MHSNRSFNGSSRSRAWKSVCSIRGHLHARASIQHVFGSAPSTINVAREAFSRGVDTPGAALAEILRCLLEVYLKTPTLDIEDALVAAISKNPAITAVEINRLPLASYLTVIDSKIGVSPATEEFLRRVQNANAERLISATQLDALLRQDEARVYGMLSVSTKAAYHAAAIKLASKEGVSHADAMADVLHKTRVSLEERRKHVGHFLIQSPSMGLPAVHFRFRDIRGLFRGAAASLLAMVVGFCAQQLTYSPITSIGSSFLVIAIVALLFLTRGAKEVVDCMAALNIPRHGTLRLGQQAAEKELAEVMICVPIVLGPRIDVSGIARKLSRLCSEHQAHGTGVMLALDFTDSEQKALDAVERLILDRLTNECTVVCQQFSNATVLFRDRVFEDSNRRWWGWERKRGKLVQLCEQIDRGEQDEAWHTLAGNKSWARRRRWMMVLDHDSWISAASLRELVAAAMHPLAQPIRVLGNREALHGVAMTCPATASISPSSISFWDYLLGARQSIWLGDDRYIGWREGVFGGKGLIHIQTYIGFVSHAIPAKCILSHDIVEGEIGRCAFVPEAVVTEISPCRFRSSLARAHRWCRGDIQNLFAVCMGRLKLHFGGRLFLIERVLGHATGLAHIVCFWTVAAIHDFVVAFVVVTSTVLVAPVVQGLFVSITRLIAGYPVALSGTVNWLVGVGSFVVMSFLLAHRYAVLFIDALARSAYRYFVSGRQLLQWTTSQQIDEIDGGVFGLHLMANVTLTAILLVALLLGEESKYSPWMVLLICQIFGADIIDLLGRRNRLLSA